MPKSPTKTGDISIVDQFNKDIIPFGIELAVPPAKEEVAVIVRGFPSSSTKNVERSYVPTPFKFTTRSGIVEVNLGGVFATVTMKVLVMLRAVSVTVTDIEYVPTYVGLVGFTFITNGLRMLKIPPGMEVAAPPLKEYVTDIVIGSPSSSTK